METTVFYHRLLPFFDAADIGPTRALAEKSGKVVETVQRAHRVDLDAAIVKIAGISGKSQIISGAFSEVAVAYALHSAADEVFARNWLHTTMVRNFVSLMQSGNELNLTVA